MASTESRNPVQPQWTETDILNACALRFDGYRYTQAHAFDYQAALAHYMATGNWLQLNEWE